VDDNTDVPRPTAATTSRPPERYGDVRPPWHRVAARTAAGVVLVGGLAWVVWAGLAQADRDVRWDDVGFSISGSSAVDVTFDVIKDPDTTAVCRLEALNRQFAVVGVVDVEVGPSPDRVVRLTETVQTQEQAVTGVVRTCTVP
jgi:hypothetical protein